LATTLQPWSVPAQPLLAATPFVDQVVAVIDQQLQLTQPSLLGSWRVEQRLAQCRPSDRERRSRRWDELR
jgi:hypothetical protein